MHRRWFEQHLPATGVAYRNRTEQLHGLSIAGPKSRELLSRLVRQDVSGKTLRFLDFRQMVVAGVPCLLGRISFTGELGYEIYCAPQYQLALFEAIEREGSDLGLRLFGARALMSLRLEKSWGVWTLDYRPDFTAAESGLMPLSASISPPTSSARPPRWQENARGPEKRLVTLVVDADQVDANRDEPIFLRRYLRRLRHLGRLCPLRRKRAWPWVTCRPHSLQSMRTSKSKSWARCDPPSFKGTHSSTQRASG